MAATSHSLLSPAPTSLPRARLAFPAVRAVALRRRPSFPAVAAAASSMASSDAEEKKETKLWGGRFEEGVTDAVERFTESIDLIVLFEEKDGVQTNNRFDMHGVHTLI